jgi:hypothetical protein
MFSHLRVVAVPPNARIAGEPHSNVASATTLIFVAELVALVVYVRPGYAPGTRSRNRKSF